MPTDGMVGIFLSLMKNTQKSDRTLSFTNSEINLKYGLLT